MIDDAVADLAVSILKDDQAAYLLLASVNQVEVIVRQLNRERQIERPDAAIEKKFLLLQRLSARAAYLNRRRVSLAGGIVMIVRIIGGQVEGRARRDFQIAP